MNKQSRRSAEAKGGCRFAGAPSSFDSLDAPHARTPLTQLLRLGRACSGQCYPSSLGRKFVELIKVKLQDFVWRLKFCSCNPVKFTGKLSHSPLVLAVKLLCGYLVILAPQSVKVSSLIVRIQKVPHLTYRIPDGWLGRFIEFSDFTLWQRRPMLLDENSKPIFCSLNPILGCKFFGGLLRPPTVAVANQISQESTENDQSERPKSVFWNPLNICYHIVICVLAGAIAYHYGWMRGFGLTPRIGSPKLFTGWGGGLDHQPQQQPVNNFAARAVAVTLSPVAVRT